MVKPTPDDRIRELTKAGALIAAEIDRLLRAHRRCGNCKVYWCAPTVGDDGTMLPTCGEWGAGGPLERDACEYPDKFAPRDPRDVAVSERARR